MLCINYNPATHDIHGFAGFLCSRVYFSVYRPEAYAKGVYYLEDTVQHSLVQFSS